MARDYDACLPHGSRVAQSRTLCSSTNYRAGLLMITMEAFSQMVRTTERLSRVENQQWKIVHWQTEALPHPYRATLPKGFN